MPGQFINARAIQFINIDKTGVLTYWIAPGFSPEILREQQ